MFTEQKTLGYSRNVQEKKIQKRLTHCKIQHGSSEKTFKLGLKLRVSQRVEEGLQYFFCAQRQNKEGSYLMGQV